MTAARPNAPDCGVERDAQIVEAAFGAILRAPLSVMVFDRQMRFLRCSDQAAARIASTPAALQGRCLFEVAPIALRHSDAYFRCLAGETVILESVPLETPAGPMRGRLNLSPWLAPDGSVAGVVVVSQDVTEAERARAAVRHADRRLTLALEMSESIVWELSYKSQRLFSTGAVAAIYDEPPTYKAFVEDMVTGVHADDRARVRALWDEHLATHRPFRTEYRIARKDGREVWVDAVAETYFDAEGEPERVIGVLKNITQSKHDRMALAHAGEAAEAANQAKSEFLANMSHEIRTPLNGVLGVAGALMQDPLPDHQRRMVGLIESSAKTLDRLLGDILDLARIEAGRFEIDAEPFSLEQLMDEVCDLFAPRMREKGLQFSLAIAPGLAGRYLGDAVRIRQILVNLLSNAVKFTGAGHVRLSAGGAVVGDRTRLLLTVEDSGVGFDPAGAESLFERFRQADGSITRRFGGSGLGLSISRSLAEQMGGTLEAASKPGDGSRFVLTLDLAAVVGETDAPDDGRDAAVAGPRMKILLAEDHPTNRKVVEVILRPPEFDLVCVGDGAAALAAFELQDFDLILMDMQMPVMDGLSATRAIRALEAAGRRPRTPILSLTANAMPEHGRAFAAAGVDGCLTKPIAAGALLAAVRAAVAQRSDAQALSA